MKVLFSVKYLFRLDDITPEMNWENFWRLINVFKRYKVSVLLGIIPENKDPNLIVNNHNKNFWQIIKGITNEGFFQISQHGYQHVCNSNKIGILDSSLGFFNQSEFVGLSYQEQFKMIKLGKEILLNNGLETDVFMSPKHSFDDTTIQALKDLGFKYITDGIALFPYNYKGIKMIPQQLWYPKNCLFGFRTICIHLNEINDEFFMDLERFLVKNSKKCKSFDEVKDYSSTKYEIFANKLYIAYFRKMKIINKFKKYICDLFIRVFWKNS